MKRFLKLAVTTLFGIILLSGGGLIAYASVKQSVTQAEPMENLLQEANTLFIEGSQTVNPQLIQQAKNKLTVWLEANSESADKKKVAQVLRSRANVALALNEVSLTIDDFEKSSQYEPLGEIQLGLCLLSKKMGVGLTELQDCYQKAVTMFSNNSMDEMDINYLIARVLSGDKAAIADYKNIVEITKDPNILNLYQMAALEYLDESVYQKIYSE
ncbi:hypothetical protein RCS94_03245 [Orbaceae bacterium ac157xtp]